jgi:hypothetical protein
MSQADANRRYREKAGLKPTSVYLSGEERAAWDSACERLGLSRRESIFAGLKALDGGGEMTNEALMAELSRRLK